MNISRFQLPDILVFIAAICNAQDNQFEVELNILLKSTLFQLAAKFLKKAHHFKSGSSFCYAKFI